MRSKPLLFFALLVSCLFLCSCSEKPLSDPAKAKVDKQLLGVWRSTSLPVVLYDETDISYLHFGAKKSIFGSMEIAEVFHKKDQGLASNPPCASFPTHIGDKHYMNTSTESEGQRQDDPTNQLSLEDMTWAIYKYEVTKNGQLRIWTIDVVFVEKSIKEGKIKGSGYILDDTSKNLRDFITNNDKSLFPEIFLCVYERVK